MAKRQADLDRGVERMLALSGTADDVKFTVTRGVTRPVWEPDDKTIALYETARGIAQSLGFDIGHQSAGGGSDGNFTGAMGIATLDGLGALGQGFIRSTNIWRSTAWRDAGVCSPGCWRRCARAVNWLNA